MNKRIKPLYIFLIMMQLIIAPSVVFAGDNLASLSDSFGEVDNIRDDAGVRDSDIKEFIQSGLKIVTSLVAIIAVGVIIIGGFMYITSAGDPKRASQAKMLMLYAVVGLLIIGGAAVIVNFVIGVYTP